MILRDPLLVSVRAIDLRYQGSKFAGTIPRGAIVKLVPPAIPSFPPFV
jgi:hypothetical protein